MLYYLKYNKYWSGGAKLCSFKLMKTIVLFLFWS